jgi:hypothetical protein
MRYLSTSAFLTLLTLSAALLAGCNNNPSPPPSIPATSITTHATINGVTQAWQNAQVSGYAYQLDLPCDSSTDGNCVISFGPVYTASNGVYVLSTEALGNVEWTFSAVDAPNDYTCPSGASDTLYPNVSGNADLYCGVLNAHAFIASPDTCTTTTDTGTGDITTDCPATITVTAENAELPTDHAMQASVYTEAGSLVVSNSITADSSTTITVPTPTTPGYSAVIVVDPNTNQILGAASFIYKQRTVHTSCGLGDDCN